MGKGKKGKGACQEAPQGNDANAKPETNDKPVQLKATQTLVIAVLEDGSFHLQSEPKVGTLRVLALLNGVASNLANGLCQ